MSETYLDQLGAMTQAMADEDLLVLIQSITGTNTGRNPTVLQLRTFLAGYFAALNHTHARSDITGLVSALAAKADLVGGVIPTSQIPSIAISEYLGTAADETAMLALTGEKGDWCNRTDTGTTFVITGDDPSDIGSWTNLNYPGAPVTSVNGQTGIVVLGKSDVGLGNVTNDAQVKAADLASQAEAEAGTDNTKWVTPLRVAQAIAALASGGGGSKIFTKLDSNTASTTSIIPIDDTRPQNTEGASYGSFEYTPAAVGENLVIEVFGYCSNSGVYATTVAIFDGVSPDCLGSDPRSIPLANALVGFHVVAEYTTTGVTPINFELRFGGNAGTAYLQRSSITFLSTSDALFWRITRK